MTIDLGAFHSPWAEPPSSSKKATIIISLISTLLIIGIVSILAGVIWIKISKSKAQSVNELPQPVRLFRNSYYGRAELPNEITMQITHQNYYYGK